MCQHSWRPAFCQQGLSTKSCVTGSGPGAGRNLRILSQTAPRCRCPEVSRQVLHQPGMPAEAVLSPVLPGLSIPLRFPLFPQGIWVQRAVGPGHLWMRAENGRILSQSAPGFYVLRTPGGSLRAEVVALPLFSGVSALLETGFQLWVKAETGWIPDRYWVPGPRGLQASSSCARNLSRSGGLLCTLRVVCTPPLNPNPQRVQLSLPQDLGTESCGTWSAPVTP